MTWMRMARPAVLAIVSVCAVAPDAAAQIDRVRAQAILDEARDLCTREAGRIWGVTLCGPLVIADPTTKDFVTNLPPPDAPPPAALGYANAAMAWGGTRWTTLVWPLVATMSSQQRRRVLVHEMFHRVQPQLALLVPEVPSVHLDAADARYWLRLEWRALAAALGTTGEERRAAIADALAFRRARHATYSGAAAAEHSLELNEGLAQYTGTVAAVDSPAAARADAITQLREAEDGESFVRTFAYPSGAAYGLLLDDLDPGWPRRLTPRDDLASRLAAAARLGVLPLGESAAHRHGAAAIRAAEEARSDARQSRLAALRQRYIAGPVLRVPNATGASFASQGVVVVPGEGQVYLSFRVSAAWGRLEAEEVLLSPDRTQVTVAGPFVTNGQTLRGPGWTLVLSDGWQVVAGPRDGAVQVVRREPGRGEP